MQCFISGEPGKCIWISNIRNLCGKRLVSYQIGNLVIFEGKDEEQNGPSKDTDSMHGGTEAGSCAWKENLGCINKMCKYVSRSAALHCGYMHSHGRRVCWRTAKKHSRHADMLNCILDSFIFTVLIKFPAVKPVSERWWSAASFMLRSQSACRVTSVMLVNYLYTKCCVPITPCTGFKGNVWVIIQLEHKMTTWCEGLWRCRRGIRRFLFRASYFPHFPDLFGCILKGPVWSVREDYWPGWNIIFITMFCGRFKAKIAFASVRPLISSVILTS